MKKMTHILYCICYCIMGNWFTYKTVVKKPQDIDQLLHRPNLSKEKHVLIIHSSYFNHNVYVQKVSEIASIVKNIEIYVMFESNIKPIAREKLIKLRQNNCDVYYVDQKKYMEEMDMDDMHPHWNAAIGTVTM